MKTITRLALIAALLTPGLAAAKGAFGLGLALVRAIAERHGGEARVVPSDEGACLEIVVPLA